MTVALGLDRWLSQSPSPVRGRRVGLLGNPTSVDARLVPTALRLSGAGAKLAAVFGPEHGLWGTEQDMIPVGEETDPLTGAPVFGLYGADVASLSPRPEWLSDLDLVVFDIQDVGSRYYTYVYTLLLTLEVASQTGVEVVVIDRPNPLGGATSSIEGAGVHPDYASFVGLFDLANRHAMTAGELAALFAAERDLTAPLTVVPLEGYDRSMAYEDTGLPWVLPSPNMPTPETAWVYPGQCLLEGTTWSEGRGTTRPFELFGAPGVDPFRLTDALHAADLPGARFRPLFFRPTFQKHAGAVCGGAQIHVTDRQSFRPYRTSLTILEVALRAFPETFGWREEAYEFVADRLAIDLLLGHPRWRQMLEDGHPATAVEEAMEPERRAFAERRAPHLRYPERP